ncbi:hypothetical protein BHE74_00010018 [Ensete ventricosum]|nr:hypothetical protein BHE74_00010018 [Ensete ventricosum]
MVATVSINLLACSMKHGASCRLHTMCCRWCDIISHDLKQHMRFPWALGCPGGVAWVDPGALQYLDNYEPYVLQPSNAHMTHFSNGFRLSIDALEARLRDMTKVWLDEVGLSPTLWGTDSSYPCHSLCTGRPQPNFVFLKAGMPIIRRSQSWGSGRYLGALQPERPSRGRPMALRKVLEVTGRELGALGARILLWQLGLIRLHEKPLVHD